MWSSCCLGRAQKDLGGSVSEDVSVAEGEGAGAYISGTRAWKREIEGKQTFLNSQLCGCDFLLFRPAFGVGFLLLLLFL